VRGEDERAAPVSQDTVIGLNSDGKQQACWDQAKCHSSFWSKYVSIHGVSTPKDWAVLRRIDQ